MSKESLKPPFLVDQVLCGSALLLAFFSLIMIYSTTGVVSLEKFSDPLFYVKRQGIAVLIGLFLLMITSLVRVNSIRKISPWCLIVSIVLLCLAFVPGLGRSSGGAQRWLNLPFLSFQPAELVKILFVIFLAGYFARRQEKLGHFFNAIVLPLFYVSVLAGILLLQPDFGSSAILTLVAISMILAAGVRLRFILYSLIPVVVSAAFLIITSPYRMKRILAFLSPEEDLQGRGYQLMQSLIAVSSGNITGVGLGDSMQKLYFLPAAHTDFIFAVVSEELGFIGAVLLLSVFLLILWRGLKIAERLIPDTFAYTLTVGLTMLLVLPALLNIGVVLGVLPTKGLVLPLVGYGGSSMICSLIIVGLLLALARHHYRHAV